MFKKTILTVATCLLAASMTVNAQINLQLKNVTVQEAITALNSAENYSVSLNSSEVDLGRKVNVSANGASILDVLSQIFAGQDVVYAVNGKTISVSKKPAQKVAPSSFKGVVVDQSGEPLIGASIMIKGGTVGTISDLDGNFTLSNVSYPTTILVSYIGLQDKEITLTGAEAQPYQISLSESTVLNEVVVVGYGVQKRVNVTGAVSVIDGKDLNNRPVTNAAAAIQGADPSLLMTFGSGSIESKNYNVTIRGNATIGSGDVTALVLIDGIEGSLSQVNPNDIESVSVLKDASACAIYGAKASAGVVLITTKSGIEGQTKISYTGRVSVSQNTTTTDFITNGYDYVNFTNEFARAYYGYNTWGYTEEQMDMLYERRNDKSEVASRPWVIPDNSGKYTYAYLGNFDWYGFLFKRNRPETEHNLTVSGGNDRVRYYASGRYLYREGFFNAGAEDKFDGVNFRAKVDAKVYKWLDYSANLSFEHTAYNYGGFWEQDGSEGYMSAGILYNLSQNVAPTYVPFNPDGTLNAVPGFMADATSPLFSGRYGPMVAKTNQNSRLNNYITLTNRLTFKIIDGLKVVADYTYRRRDQNYSYRSVKTPNSYDNVNKRLYISSSKDADGNTIYGQPGFFFNGSVYDFLREYRLYIDRHEANAYLAFNRSFGDHNVGFTAGANMVTSRQNNLTIQEDTSSSYIDIALGDITTGRESVTAYSTLGFFARANYDYKGRYLVELSGRYDGTSRFAKGSRWGFFPSASAGWRISEEPFWEPVKPYVNNAKIRISSGALGNQQVNDYYYWDKISTGTPSYTFNGTDKIHNATASDPKSGGLTWETQVTTNLGIDLGLLKDRLNVSADFYIRDTKNMLASANTLPAVYGATEPKENCADLRTMGYEISVSWRDGVKVAGKTLRYGVTATLGDNKTKITKYNNEQMLISPYYVGKTLGEIWGYRTDGLFQSDEEAAAYESVVDCKNVLARVFGSAAPNNHLMAGDVKFLDLNGDGKIDAGSSKVGDSGDREIIGNSLPRFLYSLKGDVSWYGIDLSIFFQGVGKINWMPSGYDGYFFGPYSYQRPTFIASNIPDLCWSTEEGADNSKAYFPRKRSRYLDSTGLVTNDRYLQNAAYIRLKNLTIGYTLPIKNKILDKARVYFSGENLWYWSPMRKYTTTIDPEVANTGATYGNMYPYSKTFTFGLDITF